MKVDEYISSFPAEIQNKLTEIRNLVKEIEPDALDSFAYGVPAFKLDGKNFIMYAAFKNHIGIYPGPMIIESFRRDLEGFETSKGAIKFPIEEKLPLVLLKKLIKASAGEEFTSVG